MSIENSYLRDLGVFIGVLLYLSISVVLPKILKEKNIISKKTARTIIHSFSGLAVLSTPFFNHQYLALVISILMTVLVRKSGNKSKLKQLKEFFDAIGEEEEMKYGYLQGPFSYCLAISILVAIFLFIPSLFFIPLSSIFIMMYADPAAGFIGRKYGKRHLNIPWVGNKRTIEGSFAFFVVGFICSIVAVSIFKTLFSEASSFSYTSNWVMLYGIFSALISAILELLSPSKFDDLIVPLGTSLVFLLIMLVFYY